MPSYTADPYQWDHALVIGDTYSPGEIQLFTDATGTTPLDLTGATGVVQVRTETGGALLLSPTLALTDAANGKFAWSDTAANTAVLTPGVYSYAVRLTFADGTVRTVLRGRVDCRASVIS